MERELKTGPKISRREALKSIGRAGFNTVFVAAGLEVISLIQQKKMRTRVDTANAQAKQALESNMPLEVKYFAQDVINAGYGIIKFNSDWQTEKLISGFFAGNAALDYIFGDSTYKSQGMVGPGAMAVSRATDIDSTINFSQYMEDPRFKEYGLNLYFQEQSLTLSNNPNSQDVLRLGVITAPILIGISWFFPALGEGFLGMSPVILNANSQGAALIKKCLELGDGVSYVINEKGTPNDVKDFLNHQVVYERSFTRRAASVPKK